MTLRVAPALGCVTGAIAAGLLGAASPVAAAPTGQQRPPAPPAAEKPDAPAVPAKAVLRTTTSADGTRIAFDVTGAGPAIILLHGGGQTRTAWHEAGYVERLAKQYTVIAADLRGHGNSAAPDAADAYAVDRLIEDVVAVADASGAKTFHVIGFDHGANIARYLAARSDRVQSSVLVSGSMGPAVTGLAAKVLVELRKKWLPILDAKRAGTLDVNTLPPADRAALDRGVAATVLSIGALVDYPPLEPGDIKAPTLWLVGAQDATTLENVKAYEGKLGQTQVTLQQIGSGGYSDTFFRIDAVLALVEPFLARIGKMELTLVR
jgi:pimeloyl-ACP methyl ester carboxylesterase